MTTGTGVIRKSITNGPFIYEYQIGNVMQTVVTGQTVAASMNAIRDLAAALPGNVLQIRIVVTTDG